MDKPTDLHNKSSNGVIASKISRENLARIGDLITLYNRGNSLIDYIKAPFFALTWVALLFEYFRNSFNWNITPWVPVIIAVVVVPLSAIIGLVDKKWLGIWKRQYYYELKQVNPYFEEQFDGTREKIIEVDDKVNKLTETIKLMVKVLQNNKLKH